MVTNTHTHTPHPPTFLPAPEREIRATVVNIHLEDHFLQKQTTSPPPPANDNDANALKRKCNDVTLSHKHTRALMGKSNCVRACVHTRKTFLFCRREFARFFFCVCCLQSKIHTSTKLKTKQTKKHTKPISIRVRTRFSDYIFTSGVV